jgi:hypothetical protein
MPNTAPRAWIEQHTEVLESSTSGDELELAVSELASSDNPEALEILGTFLRRAEFLGRLDEPTGSGPTNRHLRAVLAPLIESPSPEVVRLCLALADDSFFSDDPDRKSFLLEALAGVTPMKAETVDVFRRSNDEGYYVFNAPLLVANGSPRALELFVTMMSDQTVPWERRADCLHMSILPYRTRLQTLEMASALLVRDLDEPIATAVIESVFDFQWQWFGTHSPKPLPWRTAPDDVLRFVIELGTRAKGRSNVPAPLTEAIDATIDIARTLLASRAA